MTASDSSSSMAAASTEQTAMQTKLLKTLAKAGYQALTRYVIKAHYINCKTIKIITNLTKQLG
jgi:hypothetical protein